MEKEVLLPDQLEEKEYFESVMHHIDTQLAHEVEAYDNAEQELRTYLYSSWEDGTHMGASIDRLIEAVQIGRFARTQELLADKRMDKIRGLRRLLDSAYFARVDFTEDCEDELEKIYIGRHALYDEKDRTPLVYDWRAPISSIFYRFEKGPVSYDAPMGKVCGEVSLKRQYEIKKGNLEYFFDADVQISDEFLRKMLSKNTSSRMKTIVETIQKEQDVVIRDSNTDLLIVQGVAGSGKTSIALHRVAYLMYEGLQNRLNASDIVIISPNTLFESYISSVLPELGEQNITTLEFETIAQRITKGLVNEVGSRHAYLEGMIANRDVDSREAASRDMRFKTSEGFAVLVKRYKDRVIRTMEFDDVTVGDTVVAKAEAMRALMQRGEDRNSVESRLMRLQSSVFEAMRGAQEARHAQLLEEEKGKHDDPQEDAVYARMRAIDEAAASRRQLERTTRLDYRDLYRKLVTDPSVLTGLYGGKKIKNIEEICAYSKKHLTFDTISYADAMAFSWMLMQFKSCDFYRGVKQVVVDEAQDYAPLQYEMLNRLFPRARYTVLGDVNQSIGKVEDESIYETIEKIITRKKSLRITMNKSFRCTNQIIRFSSKFIDSRFGLVSFNRDGEEPRVLDYKDGNDMLDDLPKVVQSLYDAGCGNVAIITKNASQAASLYAQANLPDAQLIVQDKEYDLTGTLIVPIYMAKGLEFDGVIIFGADDENYCHADDRRLLYISATRALHALCVTYAGTPSRFLSDEPVVEVKEEEDVQ